MAAPGGSRRGIDALGSHVSYWTDNGAAYWYRTEATDDGAARRSVTETLEATLADLRARDVPYRSVQLDSWWYPHRTLRPFDTDAWDVPPTGLDRWEARDDILPDGIAALRSVARRPAAGRALPAPLLGLPVRGAARVLDRR